ncbi:MAG: hypothetical protein EXR71_19230 [Myxococcales bacterium]|nr:hypothetical protein [Myxococcales bacterium]
MPLAGTPVYRSGLVVGKFAPPHRGHQLLIEAARAECAAVTVLVYASPDFPDMPSELRAAWVRHLFPAASVHVPVDPPPDAADDLTHRVYVRDWLAARGIEVDVVYTSEGYGEGFAAVLGLPHRCVDIDRVKIGTSGTAVRADLIARQGVLDPFIFRAAMGVLRPVFAVPATMRAVIRTAAGVELRDVPTPVAGPGQALVRVVVAGVCRTDTAAATGPFRGPRVLGHEASGWVAAVGPEVDRALLGAPVAIDPRLNEGMLGVDRDGVYADFVAVSVGRLLPLPVELSWRRGAYVEPVAAALAPASVLDPDTSVLVLGQGRIASLVGAVLRRKGFDRVTVATSGPAASFDAVVECDLGVDALSRALVAVRPRGRIVLRSRTAGDRLLPGDLCVAREATIQAVGYGSFHEAVALLANGLDVDGLLGPVRPFSQAVAALNEGESQKAFLAPDPACVD